MKALATPGRPLGPAALDLGVRAVWVAMIAVTALGHVTALRNTLTVVVSIATIAVFLRDWRALPCRVSVAALALWAVASVLWSAAPETTLSKLRTDLLIPLLAGVAAFCVVRDGPGLRPVIAGLIAGLLALTALSAFAVVPPSVMPSTWMLEQFGGIVHPLPHWYPGPGDASMFTILSIAPLTLAYRAERGPLVRWRRALIVAAGALLAFVLVATNNRNAVLVVPLVVALHWLLDRRPGSRVVVKSERVERRRVAIAVAATVTTIVIVGALLELGARQRLEYLHRPLVGDSAAVELVASDTRPTIWRYFAARGLVHPWIGIGFGRTVPGIGWQTERDRALTQVEPNAYIHAHNVLLNWWLQLGAVGLLLLAGVLLDLARYARRLVTAAGDSVAARRVHHALLVTLVATLARNLTDDFLVFGMATAFCLLVGALLGELSRLARVAIPRD